MATATFADRARAQVAPRSFSLSLYLLIVFALSWPFQIAFAIWGTTPLLGYTLSSLSMIMVTVGTFIAGRYVFKDGFARAGWRWGKPKHYLAVLGLALLVWAVPVAIEQVFNLNSPPVGIATGGILMAFLLRFVLTLAPGFGEEFGWRGYMLRHLTERLNMRPALLLHAFIWWAWHLPALVGMASREDAVQGNLAISIAVVLLVSLIPAMMHAVIFAYIWASTQSLAVTSVYHAAFDEVRDALESSVGFGPLVNVWQMLVLTGLGAYLLLKAKWVDLMRQ